MGIGVVTRRLRDPLSPTGYLPGPFGDRVGVHVEVQEVASRACDLEVGIRSKRWPGCGQVA